MCHRYAGSEAEERGRIRRAASMDDFYTILAFSRRSAIFAIRERNAHRLSEGLTAISIVEQKRIDPRDGIVAVAMLDHAAREIGADANGLLESAARLAERPIAELMLGLASRRDGERELRNLAGLVVVDTPAGPGFALWGFRKYEPAIPLDRCGGALARLLKQDCYHPATVTLATSLPEVWLAGADDRALEAALRELRAGVSVSSTMLPGSGPDLELQFIFMFLIELSNDGAAMSLIRLTQEKQARELSPALLPVARGPLFCLTVARSTQIGSATIETHAGLQRFEAGVAAALEDAIRR